MKLSSFVNRVLKSVSQGQSLDADTAEQFMNQLMAGEISPIQTAGLLAAMTVRGETVEEIAGFARAMRKFAVPFEVPFEVVDTCGTGGDGANTFNISTASAIVCAAAGVPIAKHGNRAVSSKSGSADVLMALGARVDLDEHEAKQCLLDTNLCFLFAPTFHPAMKHAAEPRKQLGFRTIFNILGPLTNPARANRQVLGVFREDLVETVAHALGELGSRHALVVHGAGGIDELSLAGETVVAEVKDGAVHKYMVTPEQFGLQRADVASIAGGDAAENAAIIRLVLAGEKGPHRNVVLLNAGAALYVGGSVGSIEEGVQMAAETIDSGRAERTLQRFTSATHQFGRSEVAQ